MLIDLTQVPAMYTQSEGSLQQVQSSSLPLHPPYDFDLLPCPLIPCLVINFSLCPLLNSQPWINTCMSIWQLALSIYLFSSQYEVLLLEDIWLFAALHRLWLNDITIKKRYLFYLLCLQLLSFLRVEDSSQSWIYTMW